MNDPHIKVGNFSTEFPNSKSAKRNLLGCFIVVSNYVVGIARTKNVRH